MEDGRRRVIIEGVEPEVDCGRFPIKRAVGESVRVRADVFTDGHDQVAVTLLHRGPGEARWHELPMAPLGNDRWEGSFQVRELGRYEYSVAAWIDRFGTWQSDLRKRLEAGQDVRVDLTIGAAQVEEAAARCDGLEREALGSYAAALREAQEGRSAGLLALSAELTELLRKYPDRSWETRYGRDLAVTVDPPKAAFSTWYEFFPRSVGTTTGAKLRECAAFLPELARLGFDVLYLPPLHPIGRKNRKGKNNTTVAGPEDPGSPWAIGAEEGGHKALHPELGTLEDFETLVTTARTLGIEVAMDLAFQCAPDHPYVAEHPEWFRWRPDGTIQHAENPPKKYEDIVPFEFEASEWRSLWEELLSVPRFWIEKGVRIFRVDNPHTKPFPFWEWLIGEVKREHPEVLFLSEAFTRPRVMYRLAKLGFSQSYTYFTWRNSKHELTEYVTELTRSEVREYFRPNFWPNTPDILPEFLQYGGRPAFVIRFILAATLSSNYGMYGPAFELLVNEAVPGREEYLNSEKYEEKRWDLDRPESLKGLIARVNRIRRENPALQTTGNVRFYDSGNENVIFYGKGEGGGNQLLIAVNLDPYRTQTCQLRLPHEELGIAPGQPFLVHDLLGEDKFVWQAEVNRLDLEPHVLPARIFRVRSRLTREQDFDYFL
jgi:starch synthase (maltosyl-transferring)